MKTPPEVKAYLASIGAKGGKRSSPAKTAAAKANGKKGGRPRKRIDLGAGICDACGLTKEHVYEARISGTAGICMCAECLEPYHPEP